MKNLLCILLVFISFGIKAQQTYSISGIVSEEKGETLPGAIVFITNSKYVALTDNEGKFSFDNIQPGSYEVVIKILGFNPLVQNITVQKRSVKIIAGLRENITKLNTVTIRASRDAESESERQKYLRLFIKNFIGETVNAEKCELLNPGALSLDFNDDMQTLRASADEFLVVENKALGYKIKYLLTAFELNLKKSICTYEGYPYFEELKGTAEQQKEWGINRRVAYLSSARHFFRAAMNKTITEEGFFVYQIIDDPKDVLRMPFKFRLSIDTIKKILAATPVNFNRLFIDDKKGFKTMTTYFRATGKDTTRLGLFVIYTGEKQSPLFYKTGLPLDPPVKWWQEMKNNQVSLIMPLVNTVTIDKNGGMAPTKSFMNMGYWSWLRIADLTPLDYFGEPASANK